MKGFFRVFTMLGFLVVLYSCGTFSFPPLHKAIYRGNLEKVQKLVDRGADVNKKSGGADGVYPLVRAVDYPEIALYLISKQAKGLEPALETAVSKKQFELAKAIAGAGVDVNKNGDAFYHLFKYNKDIPYDKKLQIVQEITDNKLNTPIILLYIEPENYQAAVDAFGMNLSEKIDDSGRSILHLAAQNANLALVRYLIDKKIELNILDNNHHTALFYAITAFGSDIDWENPIIEDKTAAKIKFTSDMPYYTNARERMQNQTNIVMGLLKSEININQQNKYGWTVLHFASASYPKGLQELLIANHADKDIKTAFGRTADDILKLREQ
jgi:ankyrin repeat protein